MSERVMDFEVYAVGICYASICTVLDRADIKERMNREHPSGTENGWMLSDDPTFKDGEPNPSPCDQRSGTHKHYLMVC